ncbi:MAG: ATP-binding cassette domain-containing protein [Cohaesibacteraceae bacterium]|nr:ATP-binding cassette domain-containing protein [Cohaesibacteraceae bacterium]
MKNILSCSDLTGGYGDTKVVFDISVQLGGGEILGIFGRNGVGKSTLAKLLAGHLLPGAGEVHINGARAGHLGPHQRHDIGVGYMPQTGMIFDGLTVNENLSIGEVDKNRDEYFELFPKLAERLDQKAGSMSGGERKILGFVRAMLDDTIITILDEPSEGVQPENIAHMETCLRNKQKAGHAFILIEQNLNLLLPVSDQLLGLESGEVKFRRPALDTTRDQIVDFLAI